MLLTEEEAKTKWCPMARMVRGNTNESPVNRVINPANEEIHIGGCMCIASCCMMWRKDFLKYERCETENETFGNMSRSVPPADGEGWENVEFESGAGRLGMTKWRRALPSTRGYCGLSGKPEIS